MQLFNSKTITRLLALFMIVVLALGCFAGCGNDNISDDDDDDKGSSKGDLVKYEWDGLIYFLDEDFGKPTTGTYAMHTDGDMTAIVAGAPAKDGITNSASAARAYVNQVASLCESIKTEAKNGVSYTIMVLEDGTTEIRGFYVHEDYAWEFYIITYDYDAYGEEMISYVTSAEIDKDYQHTDNNGNGDNSGNSGSIENSGNTGSSDTPITPNPPVDPNPGTPSDPSPGDLVKYDWDGLTYYLGAGYTTTELGRYVMHAHGENAIVVIGGSAPSDVTNSRSFAQKYIDDMAEEGYTGQLYQENGVYYTVVSWNDGTTEARAFYIYNGYGWNICATTYDFNEYGPDLIKYVISGEIDPNYQHEDSSGTSGGTSSGDSSGNTAPSPIDPNYGQSTVYTCVPRLG